MYALLDSQGSIAQYPYTISQLRLANPNVSFPDNFPSDPSKLAEFSMVEVQSVEIPLFDEKQYKIVYGDPVETDGVWSETYELVALTTEEKNEYCDYNLFWTSLVNSALYDFIIQQAASDIQINALSTELATLTAEARSRNYFPSRFQECIWKITETVSFTEDQSLELSTIFTSSNLDLIYSLVRPA